MIPGETLLLSKIVQSAIQNCLSNAITVYTVWMDSDDGYLEVL